MLTAPSFFQLAKAEDAHNPWTVDFSPDGRWLAVGWSKRGILQLHDRQTGQVTQLPANKGLIRFAEFSSDSRWLLTGDNFAKVRLWSIKDGECVRTWEMDGWPQPYFAEGNTRMVVGLINNGERTRWESYSLQGDDQRVLGHTGGVIANQQGAGVPDLDPTRRWLAQPVGNRLELYDLHDLAVGPVREIGSHGDIIKGVVFSPDASRVLSFDAHGLARLWDISSAEGGLIREFNCAQNALGAAFSPGGNQLVISGQGGISLWDLDQPPGVEPVVLETDYWMFNAAFSPDGNWLATTSTGATVGVWPIDRQYPLTLSISQDREIHPGSSPDGKWLVTADPGGRILGWPLEGRKIDQPGNRIAALGFQGC